jgi:hypothetical protein
MSGDAHCTNKWHFRFAKVDAGKMSLKSTFKIEVFHFIDAPFIRTKIQEKNLKLIKEYDANTWG